MWLTTVRHIPTAALALLVLFGGGCTTVPKEEFKAYTEAFAEVKGATEQLLLEYDSAKRIEAEARAKAEANANGEKKTAQPVAPYPTSVTISFGASKSTDHVGARRQALEVVSNFNAALVS